MSHDELVRNVRDVAERIDANVAGRAFVAALRSRRFEHWSSLASFAVARTLSAHDFFSASEAHACGVCGASLRVDAFASDVFAHSRAHGTVRTDSLRYTLFDLEAFVLEDVVEPTDDDHAFFDTALARIANVRPALKTFAAERALGVPFASRIERKLFLGVLGACGVLDSRARPGFWPAFVAYEDRAHLDATPYTYPVTWWRRDDGIDLAALEAFGLRASLSHTTIDAIGYGRSV